MLRTFLYFTLVVVIKDTALILSADTLNSVKKKKKKKERGSAKPISPIKLVAIVHWIAQTSLFGDIHLQPQLGYCI